MVSIITPFYNAEKYLRETIESVLKQSYTDWELLLINDGSSDDSGIIAQAFAAKSTRIRYLNLEKNQGAGVARNFGIKAARGDKIAFLDADDLWKPHKLEYQIQFMKTHDASCCYSSYELIDASGQPLNRKICARSILSFRTLEKANYIGNLTGIYDRSKLGKMYGAPLVKRQDWTLWLSVIKKAGTAYGIEESLAYYRVHDSSISRNKYKLVKYNYFVYKKYLGYSTIKSCYKMLLFLREQLFIKPRQVLKF